MISAVDPGSKNRREAEKAHIRIPTAVYSLSDLCCSFLAMAEKARREAQAAKIRRQKEDKEAALKEKRDAAAEGKRKVHIYT